jgi:hypothetical protein
VDEGTRLLIRAAPRSMVDSSAPTRSRDDTGWFAEIRARSASVT